MSDLFDQVRDHFLAALGRDGLESQLRYAAEHCADTPELHRNLEEMLMAHHKSGGFLESEGEGTPRLPSTTEKLGTQIGPFKLLQELGHGGMGIVYMAEQSEPVARRVALKVIKPGMDTGQVIARFDVERQALAMMDHPNIAKVLDAGTTDSGRPYFAMELVKGIPITRYCDQHRLTPRERLALFAPVCQAVQHAHQKGIIHRDLKPNNILVAKYDDHAVPKVIDFGVAKATAQRFTDRTMFTQFGQIIGTLEYMSPEQAQLNQLDIDTRSDIYSLGVLLYELLTGSTPFRHEPLRAAALEDMMRIIREEDPPRPSVRLTTVDGLASIAANRKMEPKKLSAFIRGDLDWIVMKALEKDRTRRYESANSFQMDIHHYLNDEAVAACPPSAAYRFRKFARRNKATLSMVALVTILILIGAGVATIQAVRATRAERIAQVAKERAEMALVRAVAAEKRQRRLTDSANERLRHQLYVSDMFTAGDAWRDGEVWMLEPLLRRHLPRQGEEDLRQFEWYYWWRIWKKSHPHRRLELPDGLKAVAYSPDGTKLAAVFASDRSLVLIDGGTGEVLKRFDTPGLSGSTRQFVVFSPDGETLAHQAESRAVVRLTSLLTGDARDLIGHQEEVYCAAFSPDGAMLATGSADGTLRIWKAGKQSPSTFSRVIVDLSPDPERTLARQSAGIASCVFSPNGKLLAFSCDQQVIIYDLGSKMERTAIEHDGPVGAIAFSPDGRFIASGSRKGALKLYNLSNGTTKNFSRSQFSVEAIVFSPDGKFLASAANWTIELWDLSDLRSRQTLIGHSGVSLAFLPEKMLGSASLDRSLVWDLSHVEAIDSEVHGFGAEVGHVAFCPSGEVAVEVAGAERLHLWNPATGVVRYIEGSGPFAISRNGIAATAVDRTAHFWNLETGEAKGQFRSNSRISAAEFSPSDRVLALGLDSGAVQLVDVSTGELVSESSGTGHILDVAFSPDGRTVASAYNVRYEAGGFAGEVKSWDLDTKRQLVWAVGFGCGLLSVDYSPDGRYLAVGRQFLGTLVRDTHKSQTWPFVLPVASMAVKFGSDKTLFSSGAEDSALRIWDVEMRQQRCALPIGNQVADIALSADGKTLAVASLDGTVRLFRAATEEQVLAAGWRRDNRKRPEVRHAPAPVVEFGSFGHAENSPVDTHVGTVVASGEGTYLPLDVFGLQLTKESE